MPKHHVEKPAHHNESEGRATPTGTSIPKGFAAKPDRKTVDSIPKGLAVEPVSIDLPRGMSKLLKPLDDEELPPLQGE